MDKKVMGKLNDLAHYVGLRAAITPRGKSLKVKVCDPIPAVRVDPTTNGTRIAWIPGGSVLKVTKKSRKSALGYVPWDGEQFCVFLQELKEHAVVA